MAKFMNSPVCVAVFSPVCVVVFWLAVAIVIAPQFLSVPMVIYKSCVVVLLVWGLVVSLLLCCTGILFAWGFIVDKFWNAKSTDCRPLNDKGSGLKDEELLLKAEAAKYRPSKEAALKAGEAASKLKEQLLERVRGYQSGASSCGGGEIKHDCAAAVDITYPEPNGEYADMIGQWLCWSIGMREVGKDPPPRGYNYSVGLSNVIPESELYPMFRNAFEPIGISVNHPVVQCWWGKPDLNGAKLWGSGSAKDGSRDFAASGRTVVVIEGSPVYLQPVGDLAQSTWLNVELRVDSKLEEFSDQGYLMTCHIDPFCIDYRMRRGRNTWPGNYYRGREEDVEKVLTFYILIHDQSRRYIPVARLIAYDSSTGAHTFELDENVVTVPEADINHST